MSISLSKNVSMRIKIEKKPFITPEEIVEIIQSMNIPVYEAEKKLGIPSTTLHKAIKGQRLLSEKWTKILKDSMKPCGVETDHNEIKPEEKVVSENEIPPRPTNKEFGGLELKMKQAEWDILYRT